MVQGWGHIARKAAGSAAYWLVLGLTAFLGISAVINIETTETRLVLVVVVLGVAFGAASFLERLLGDFAPTGSRRNGEPTDIWPHWYSQFGEPTVCRWSDRVPYSYVVLPLTTAPQAADCGECDPAVAGYNYAAMTKVVFATLVHAAEPAGVQRQLAHSKWELEELEFGRHVAVSWHIAVDFKTDADFNQNRRGPGHIVLSLRFHEILKPRVQVPQAHLRTWLHLLARLRLAPLSSSDSLAPSTFRRAL